MIQRCALVSARSNHIIKIGSKNEICNIWAKLKYKDAPDEEYLVKEIQISYGKELSKEQINQIVEDDYNKE